MTPEGRARLADLADLAESVMERCDGAWMMTRKEIAARLFALAVVAEPQEEQDQGFVEGTRTARFAIAPLAGQEPTNKPAPSLRPGGEPRVFLTPREREGHSHFPGLANDADKLAQRLWMEADVGAWNLVTTLGIALRYSAEIIDRFTADAAAAALPPCPGIPCCDNDGTMHENTCETKPEVTHCPGCPTCRDHPAVRDA